MKKQEKKIFKVGEGILKIREKRGMTLQKLSVLTNIKFETLSLFETSNSVIPTKQELKKIAKCLEVPEEVFMLLSLKKEDISKEKKKMFGILFPTIKKLIEDII